MTRPLVTAVMAARDAEDTIEAAIGGVLAQTLEEFELLVVDDGSRDRTAEVAASYDDRRVVLVRLESNAGRGAARNVALERARGSLVAVCDADDVSLPGRFALQAGFLAEQEDVGVVGGQVLNFGPWGGPQAVYRYPTSRDAVEARFEQGQMPVPHQASMIRAVLLQRAGGYAAECRRCQDLELFLRLRPHTAMTNLDEPVLLYRHDQFTSLKYWLTNGSWRRYAVTRSRAVLSGSEPPSYDEFSRRAGAAVDSAVDCVTYVRSQLHQRLVGVRSL